MTREEAVKVIDGRFEIMDYCESAKLEEALDIAIKALEQPERKKGKWDFMGWQMFQCSECKHTFTQDFLEGWREYNIGTGIYVEEYTEPDRKAIDLQHAHDIENVAKMNYKEGAKDVWEFVMKCLKMDGNDFYEIFDSCDALCLTNLSYQQAKAKYEAWRKQKDEIRVGDEVLNHLGKPYIIYKIQDATAYGVGFDECPLSHSCFPVYYNKKTGRHFDEIEELLNKMRGE